MPSRRSFLASSAALIAASSWRRAVAGDEWGPQEKYFITEDMMGEISYDDIPEWEKTFVVDALGALFGRVFHPARWANYHSMIRGSGYQHSDEGWDEALKNDRLHALSMQFSRLDRIVRVNRTRPFPRIRLYGYYADPNGQSDEDKRWGGTVERAARTHINIYEGEFEGAFEVGLNNYYIGWSDGGRWYMDPNFWLGPILHGMCHNLGHGHPHKDDPLYHHYQINLLQYCMMSRQPNYRRGDPPPMLR